MTRKLEVVLCLFSHAGECNCGRILRLLTLFVFFATILPRAARAVILSDSFAVDSNNVRFYETFGFGEGATASLSFEILNASSLSSQDDGDVTLVMCPRSEALRLLYARDRGRASFCNSYGVTPPDDCLFKVLGPDDLVNAIPLETPRPIFWEMQFLRANDGEEDRPR